MTDGSQTPLNVPNENASPIITDELRKQTLQAARAETERQLEGKSLGRKAQDRGMSR